jgi:membrane protease YdiL (CAAX protease family)
MNRGANADVAASIVTLTYSAVLNELLPDSVHVPANLAAAAAVLTLARHAGASTADLGLESGALRSGARAGFAVAAPVVVGIAVAAYTPSTAQHFDDARVRGHSRRRSAYETVFRIPFGTALGEELLFRSALLALFMRRYSTAGAVAASSALFGLWHVLPALHSVGDNSSDGTIELSRGTVGRVAGTVVVTSAAGVGLALLRLRSRSILAPAIVHAAVNSSAFVAARFSR